MGSGGQEESSHNVYRYVPTKHYALQFVKKILTQETRLQCHFQKILSLHGLRSCNNSSCYYFPYPKQVALAIAYHEYAWVWDPNALIQVDSIVTRVKVGIHR